MIRSMTGYGTAAEESEALKAAVTVRSLNHRYLDVSVPDRPVAGPRTLDSPVEVETATSSGA